ncbi:hypothetical protein ACTAZI_07210, partial [Legionella bozemanae]|uniref:hypothetical protein n=1 Tax=Legionella bozemanae TaxID=447 RepID=UPI003EEDCBCB
VELYWIIIRHALSIPLFLYFNALNQIFLSISQALCAGRRGLNFTWIAQGLSAASRHPADKSRGIE